MSRPGPSCFQHDRGPTCDPEHGLERRSDSTVCDFAHVAPGSRTAGNVRIGEGALLGIGSCVLPQQSVGAVGEQSVEGRW